MKQRIRNVVTLAEHCDQALVADAVKDDTQILRLALGFGFDFVLRVVGRRRVAATSRPPQNVRARMTRAAVTRMMSLSTTDPPPSACRLVIAQAVERLPARSRLTRIILPAGVTEYSEVWRASCEVG